MCAELIFAEKLVAADGLRWPPFFPQKAAPNTSLSQKRDNLYLVICAYIVMRGGQCYYNNQNKLIIDNATEIGGKT